PNFDQAWFFWNTFPEFATGPGNFLFDLGVATNALPSKPGTFVENTDVVYQVDLDPTVSAFEQALNDSIARVAADPSARSPNGLANVPAVLGDPPVPVLTLHNLGDLFVPFHNEIVYAGEVAANGASDNLVQRAIRGVNHCGFTTEELVRGFSDLVAWVDGGPKPDGDDVLDPAVVAAADYGCRFTEPISGHLLPQPCP
ncbi:MAG: phthalyl amidase, partial [Acidimicrobiia bacterium]|nr:phthalyl amidase [Acidimicrobiia bacterium]